MSMVAFVLMQVSAGAEWRQTPVKIASGPLFFATSPVETEGRRIGVHYVTAPGGVAEPGKSGAPAIERSPQEWLRCRGNTSLKLRLSEMSMLVESYQEPRGLAIVDLAAGTTMWVPDGAPHGFLEQDGATLYHTQSNGRDDWLCRWTIGSSEPPQRVSELALTRIFPRQDASFFVIESGEPATLWELPPAPAPRRLLGPVGISDMANLVCVELSPDGKRVAVSSADAGRLSDYRLRIFDRATGTLVREWKDIDVTISALASSIPALKFCWLDDERLRFSETESPPGVESRGLSGWMRFVDVDLASGARLREQRYSLLALGHERPTLGEPLPPGPRRVGHFAVDGLRLWFAGDAKPFFDAKLHSSSAQWDDVTVAPAGDFATLVTREGKSFLLELVDGATRARRPLHRSWAYDLAWFPAFQE